MEELRSMGERYNVKVTIETVLSVPALPSAGSYSYEPAAKKKKVLSEGHNSCRFGMYRATTKQCQTLSTTSRSTN